MSTLLDAVLQYIKSGPTDYAVMITGPWGSGKSYFWRQSVIPAIRGDARLDPKPTILYVSLYGVTAWATVEASVLWQLHPKLQPLGKVGNVIGRAVLQYFGQDSLAEKMDISSFIDKLPKQDQIVICFDDLERSGIPIAEVMGHINQFVEHLGAKVLILCNETEVESKIEDVEAKKEYVRTKEKVVRVTRTFDIDHDPIIRQIIDDSYRGPYRDFLSEHLAELTRLFAASGLQNLRILKYGLDVMGVAFAQLLSIASDDVDRRAKLIYTLLPLTFETQAGRMDKDTAGQMLTDGAAMIYATALKPDDSSQEPGPVTQYVSRYRADEFIDRLLMSPALSELVTTGYLDPVRLADEYNAEKAKRSKGQLAVRTFHRQWYKLDDAEFAETLRDALDAVSAGEISSWDTLSQMIRSLDASIKLGATDTAEDDVRAAFEKGIQNLRSAGRFERKEVWSAAHEIRTIQGDGPLVGWLRAKMLMVNRELEEATVVQKARAAFQKIGSDAAEFARMMSRSREGDFGDRPMAPIVSPEEFVAKVTEASNVAKQQLSSGLHSRYRDNDNIAALRPDMVWLSDVATRLDTWLASKGDVKAPSILLLRQVLGEVTAGRERLELVQPKKKPDGTANNSDGGNP